jgi:malto-oligosyltrehalose trehalohydrolase
MPFGAEIRDDGAVRFALWAPSARSIALELNGVDVPLPLEERGDGWHELVTAHASAGTRYRYVVNGDLRVPDPASRFQPEGVHGASEVVNPRAFAWSDGAWQRPAWETSVLYELHVGAFTTSGTYEGVIERLDALVELGVTAIELMPLSATPGTRNWGYDGVLHYAPNANYGRPDALKRLIAAAHAKGLAVVIDVVYNHFGPEGNYSYAYAAPFFTERYHTPWGAAIDYESRREVREFVIHNALYWLEEYNADGLRFDAVQTIYDRSRPDLLEELAERIVPDPSKARAFTVLETDENRADRLASPSHRRGRYDAQWNDDVHHALHVLLTGESDGYYQDFREAPAALLARALSEGFAYQGETSRFRGGAPRGEPSAQLPPCAFVNFLQNHDQVGNRAFGERITMLAPMERVRAAVATLLLAPAIPMLFMGEEWGASSPFLFFCDFEAGLASKVRQGRRQEFARFAVFTDTSKRARIPDPGKRATFERSILNWREREQPEHRELLAFYQELLAIRAREIAPRLSGIGPRCGRVLTAGKRTLSVAWTLADRCTLTLRANLSDLPSAFPPPEGNEIFATFEGRAAHELPPWSATYHLGGPDT